MESYMQCRLVTLKLVPNINGDGPSNRHQIENTVKAIICQRLGGINTMNFDRAFWTDELIFSCLIFILLITITLAELSKYCFLTSSTSFRNRSRSPMDDIEFFGHIGFLCWQCWCSLWSLIANIHSQQHHTCHLSNSLAPFYWTHISVRYYHVSPYFNRASPR